MVFSIYIMKKVYMVNFRYKAMDANGEEVDGVLAAASEDEAFSQLKEYRVFPTSITISDEEPTLVLHDSIEQEPEELEIPEGRLLEKGEILCRMREYDFGLDGSFNILGKNKKLYFIFDKVPGQDEYLKIPFDDIEYSGKKGFIFKQFVLRLKDGTEYRFKDNVNDIDKLCMFGNFCIKSASGNE